MRNQSMAAEAIILNVRSMNAASKGKIKGRADVAAAWVEQAITAGGDPFMRQEPLSSGEQAGEWLLVTSKDAAGHPNFPGRLVDEHFDEVFVVLARLGRLRPDAELKPWHGNVLPEDSSCRAVALRVNLAREALALGLDVFYRGCGVNANACRAREAGHRAFASIDNEMLAVICAHNAIPEEWVLYGTAEEIEA